MSSFCLFRCECTFVSYEKGCKQSNAQHVFFFEVFFVRKIRKSDNSWEKRAAFADDPDAAREAIVIENVRVAYRLIYKAGRSNRQRTVLGARRDAVDDLFHQLF